VSLDPLQQLRADLAALHQRSAAVSTAAAAQLARQPPGPPPLCARLLLFERPVAGLAQRHS